jgi:hypothetical protein
MVTYLSPSQINSIPFCNFTITGIIKPHTPAVACDTLVCDAAFFLPPTQPLSTATYFRYSILLSATSLHLHLHPTVPMAVVYNPPFHCSTSQPALCFGPTGLARSSSCGGETCTLCDVAFFFLFGQLQLQNSTALPFYSCGGVMHNDAPWVASDCLTDM